MSDTNSHHLENRMVQFFSKRRLKIAEQIIIVIFFAVLIPMTVSGVIINNIISSTTNLRNKRNNYCKTTRSCDY